MSAKMRQILSTRYFSKLLELPQSWFDEELTGSITSKLTRSITNVTDFAKAFSNNFFTLLLTTFAVLIISAIYYWPLALLLAIVFPIYVWLTALTSRNWQTHQDVINHHIDTAGGRFQEVVSQIRVVKSYVTGWLGDIMSAKMRQILSTRYFSKLLELPQSWFDEELTGSITSKLTRSITNVTDFAKAFSNNFFTLLLTTFAVLIISAIYYWPLALLLAIVFPIYVWLTALTSRNWQTHQDVINHHIDTAGGRFQEVVSQIRVVKSYVTEASEQKQFNNHYDATVDATRQQSNHWHLMDTVRRVVLNVIFFGIYAIIFVRTAKGYFGVGDMILLIQLMTMARQPVQMMSYIIDVAQRAVAGSKDYFSVMETRPAHVPQTATTTIREPEPGVPMISFNDTVFSYDGTNRVIDHVTFDVSPGEKVALVGESGVT